jgi:NCAIR mutase (PurE)-related protein
MNPDALRDLLSRVASGDTAVEAAVDEVIFGEGKTAAQVATIAREMIERSGEVLVTRIDAAKAAAVMDEVPGLAHHADARILVRARRRAEAPRGLVAVVSAGTSDQPVAEEAALTLDFLGVGVRRYRDLGVSGLHRLLAERRDLGDADVLVVVAGMEGALPSVVGGLMNAPVIAVPTSIGYGASFGGLAALLAMMNSCAPGVVVVNIDNGFGAAVAAAGIVRAGGRSRAIV